MALDPERAASDLRDSAWGDRGFPVDPVTIAHSLDIRVVETDLPGEVSGALLKEKGKDALIIVDNADSNNRKRFTVAHELGHYIARSQEGKEEFEFIDLRSPESSAGTNPDEIFANRFAASLLMPASAVRKMYKKQQSAAVLASYFGVSSDAMSNRLRNLRLVTPPIVAEAL